MSIASINEVPNPVLSQNILTLENLSSPQNIGNAACVSKSWNKIIADSRPIQVNLLHQWLLKFSDKEKKNKEENSLGDRVARIWLTSIDSVIKENHYNRTGFTKNLSNLTNDLADLKEIFMEYLVCRYKVTNLLEIPKMLNSPAPKLLRDTIAKPLIEKTFDSEIDTIKARGIAAFSKIKCYTCDNEDTIKDRWMDCNFGLDKKLISWTFFPASEPNRISVMYLGIPSIESFDISISKNSQIGNFFNLGQISAAKWYQKSRSLGELEEAVSAKSQKSVLETDISKLEIK